MEYYPSIEEGTLTICNSVMSSEGIPLSEMRHTDKDQYYIFTLMWNINMLISEVECRMVIIRSCGA